MVRNINPKEKSLTSRQSRSGFFFLKALRFAALRGNRRKWLTK